jgi:Flp pilus assembly protein TadB
MSHLAASVSALAARCPWDPPADSELARAVGFLGWPVTAGEVLAAGDLLALAVAGGAWLVAGFLVGTWSTALVLAGVCGVAVAALARYVPRLLATARRTRALGEAPGLVSRAVLRMRLSPTPETAAAFAAETGRGRLATSLAEHVRQAGASGHSGLQTFADEWADWFPALRRALTLVESAGSAHETERARALDSALDVTLDGTRETMAEFAASVRGPATAIYAFGVLLPLALVAMLPAAGTVGLSISAVTVVLVYDVALPAALVTASAWLLSRRPVAFPPPSVPRSHPDVSARPWLTIALAIAVAASAGWLTGAYVAPWAMPLAATGCGVGVALVARYRPTVSVRARVTAVEDGIADALYLVGREVQRGRAVEAAMAEAATAVDTEAGSVLADATRRQRQLKVGVRESLLGEHGALDTVPSERARSTAALLSLAASEGRPAGSAIVAMADHLDELQRVEREARRNLRQVTDTLAHTAAVFGPLVGGATVTLAERMAVDGPLSGNGGVAPDALGLVVGAYVLLMAAVLTALATGLERGFDRSLVGYRVGRALLAATGTFLVALAATRALV